MKIFPSVLMVVLFFQLALAQEGASNKDVLYENPVTKEKIRIEIGNQVTIKVKSSKVAFTRH